MIIIHDDHSKEQPSCQGWSVSWRREGGGRSWRVAGGWDTAWGGLPLLVWSWWWWWWWWCWLCWDCTWFGVVELRRGVVGAELFLESTELVGLQMDNVQKSWYNLYHGCHLAFVMGIIISLLLMWLSAYMVLLRVLSTIICSVIFSDWNT